MTRLPGVILRSVLCALGAALLSTRALGAQAPTMVPIGDPAYAQVDRLAGAGLVDTMIVGQRPYTRAEFAAIVRDARRNAASGGQQVTPTVRGDLDALAARFTAPPPGTRFVDAIALITTSTNEQPRWVPATNGGGGAINAIVAPLALEAQDGGRDVMQGTTVALETWHRFTLGSHLVIEAHPRLRLSTDSSFAGEHTLSFQELTASTQFSNVAITVGREHLEWGIGRHATEFLSDNAPGLDQIRISSARPWVLPGFLRGLGANSASIFIADLGPRQYFPHSQLIGYTWSFTPQPDFEFGVDALNIMGGDGGPKATFWQRLANVVLFPRYHFSAYQFSNSIAGLYLRYRMRRLANAELYWDMDLDDFDFARVGSSIWADDGAQVFGLSLPQLGRSGAFAATLEFHHTGERFNRHAQFRSGATLDGLPFGDPLGPNADGGYAYVDWQAPSGAGATLELAEEAYRNNQYAPDGPGTSLVHIVQWLPQERRLRAMLTLHSAPVADRLQLNVQGGVEHVSRFDFVNGATRNEGLVSVALTYCFDACR